MDITVAGLQNVDKATTLDQQGNLVTGIYLQIYLTDGSAD